MKTHNLPKLMIAFTISFVIQIPSAFAAEDPKPAGWLLESVELQNHDNKSYSAGKFILFPTRDHRFVLVKFKLMAQNPDPKAIEELAAIQRLAAADKKALEELKTSAQCFDMSKLALVDATDRRHTALWNTDNTIPTDVVTLTGVTAAEGRDPAHWSKSKRTATKMTRETREKLIKSKTIEANHPDFRTTFSGLLEVNQEVAVTFLFQLPDSVSRDGLQLVYGNEAPVPLGGFPAVAANKPDGSPESKPVPTSKPGDGIPNWRVENIAVTPYGGGAAYSRDQVTLNPTAGEVLVEASFTVTPLRNDQKAMENYARTRNGVNQRVAGIRFDGGRFFENRSLALVDRKGNRHIAKWYLGDGVRTSVYTAEIVGNRTSSHMVSNWKHVPSDIWLDAEQSFITRTIRPPNQPAIVEHVTLFGGILFMNKAAKLSFLFSVPAGTDFSTLKLELDSESFSLEPTTTP